MRIEIEVPDGVNEVQALQVALLRRISFNDCDGGRVAEDLLAHRGLWRSFVTTDRHAVRLRDIADCPDLGPGGCCWNADTLLIWATAGREAELEALVRSWSPSEVGRIDQDDPEVVRVHGGRCWLGGALGQVLRVWWD